MILLKVGVIGIGNCGNQVAALCKEKKAITSIGINSSEKDVDAIKSKIDVIIIGNMDGSGKDRSIAKRYFKEEARKILGKENFTAFMNGCDVIFIVTSTGGGTGSGIGPILTDVLRNYYPKKLFINIGVLPALSESVGAQRNTIEYLTEVDKLGREDQTGKKNEGSYLLFDNENAGARSTDEIMQNVNASIVETISVIRGDRNKTSEFGMIDDRDFLKIISTPGMIFMDILNDIFVEKIPPQGDVEDLMLENIKMNNRMVTIDRDKIVYRMAFIANLTKDLHPYFNASLPKIRDVYGEPVEDFSHFAVNSEEEAEMNSMVLIIAGLSMPENRLKGIHNRIKAVEEALKKTKTRSLLGSLGETVSQYDGTKEGDKEVKEKQVDMNDIFSKY